jgi:hypothetical protein
LTLTNCYFGGYRYLMRAWNLYANYAHNMVKKALKSVQFVNKIIA